jgi:hypothetical protein
VTPSFPISLPASALASLLLTSLRRGVSSLGAGNWLARNARPDTRQPFFSQALPCGPHIAQGLDHRLARPIVRKSLHADGCESAVTVCHGAECGVLRHV